MPSIQISDYTGRSFQITSGNPVLVGAWLAEVCGEICSANTQVNHPIQVRIDVWPVDYYNPVTKKHEMDWTPGKNNSYVWNGEQLKLLADILNGVDKIPKSKFDKNGVYVERVSNIRMGSSDGMAGNKP